MNMRLVVSCAGPPGIISAVSGFLAQRVMNLLRSDQYSSDPARGTFFLRMEFTGATEEPAERFGPEVGRGWDRDWRASDAAVPKRVATLVSREDRCLQ